MIEPTTFAWAAAACLGAGLAAASLRPAWVVDHPRAVLFVLALVSAAAAVMLVRVDPPGFTVDIDPASEPLLRRGDPAREVYRQATRDFGNDDLYVVAMETDDVFRHENLDALDRLTNRLRQLPGVASVESLTWTLSIRYDAERDSVGVKRFMKGVPEDAAERERLRSLALADPLYRKTLVSLDGRTAAINITFQPMTDGEFVALDLDGRIAALLGEENGGGRRFYVAGRPHVRSQAYHTMVGDLARLIPIAVMIAAFAIWLMSGTVRGVLIPLGACLTATLWVFGGLAVLSIDINLITLVLASMMICIGSVYGVHVFERYRIITATAESSRDAAMRCLMYTRTPVLMAGFTTCIGFGALLLTDIQATNELGSFSILGVASVTLISLTGVPAMLVLLPYRPLSSDPESLGGTRLAAWFGTKIDTLLIAIGRLTVRRSGAILASFSVLTLGAALVIPRIVIDTDVITFFLKDSRVRTDFAAVTRLLTGAVPIYVVIAGDEEGTFREPETLEAVERLQRQLEAVPGVSQVLSSVDFIRAGNRAMHEGREQEARVPRTRAAVAEATFLIPKAKLRRFATSNHSRGNLVVRTGQAGSAAVLGLEARIREVLAKAELPEGFTTEVTGNAILLNRSANSIAGNQAMQVGFAAGAIFVLICGVFRSLRTGLISMVPNVVPVLMFFGVLGAGLAPLSLPTSLIGSIALGIAIDDTMHFLVAYRTQRVQGRSPEEAVASCVRGVGRPIVMTSVMLVVGFLVILASGFATLREFGYLTALTMAICLSTDLILLPALLVRVRA